MKIQFLKCGATGTSSQFCQLCLGLDVIFTRRRNRHWRTCLSVSKSSSTNERRNIITLYVFGLWTLHIRRKSIWIACGRKSESCVKITGRRSIFRDPTSPLILFYARLFNIRCRQLFRHLIMKATSTRCHGPFTECLITLIAQMDQFCQALIPSRDS